MMAKATTKEQEKDIVKEKESEQEQEQESFQPPVDSQDGIIRPTAEDVVHNSHEYKHWIKMSHDEMLSAQESETLIGYNPEKRLGLVKVKEIKKK